MLEVSKITRGHTCVGSSVFYEFGSIEFVSLYIPWPDGLLGYASDCMCEKAMTTALLNL